MMNFKGRFKAIIAMLAVASCARSDANIITVTPDSYRDDRCWFAQNGDLVAYLVLAQDGEVAVPYLVSKNCVIYDRELGYAGAILDSLNTLRMIDSSGTLSHALPRLTISDNVRTDQAVPSSGSRLFYFRARIARIPDTNMNIYAPIEIRQLLDSGMTFEELLTLPGDDRRNLLIESQRQER